MSLLQVENLIAGYGKKTIVNDVSLELHEGEMVGILGPNGCGKSTMIKALCKGISYQGTVSICGQDIKKMSEKDVAKICSYVPQRSGLSIDIPVLDVLLMGFYPNMALLERPNSKMKEQARKMLECLGLSKEADSNYMELSEGQKRLCILGRSLVTDAKLLLLDEPDASLDFAVRNHFLQIISKRVKADRTGVLISLHDVDLALSYCDKIYLMKDGIFLDIIQPQTDPILEMEQKLNKIYGNAKLVEYSSENDDRHLAMVFAK